MTAAATDAAGQNGPLRIAIPIHSFEPGGVERVALRLAQTWDEAGHAVTVVLGRDRGRCRAEAPPLAYCTRPEPVPTDRWETLWMVWCLWRYLARNRADVIFCPGNTYTFVCVMVRLLRGDRDPPVLVKISNDLVRPDFPRPVRPFYRLWVRLQGRMLDRFVALGEPMLEHMVEELGIGADRALVIADPALSQADIARLGALAQSRPRTGARRFVSVGRLVAQKNYTLLIDAFALIAQPGDSLTIAGEGPERTKLEGRVRAHGLAASIHLPGHVDDVTALLADSDLFVLSSDYEGVPAVIIEALAAGLPIAATDCCASMGWLLGEGRFGVLAPKDEPRQLAQAMEEAMEQTPPRAEMRAFASRFTLEQAGQSYLAAMQRLVAAPTH